MGQALLTVGNLSAWYSEEKMILSGFSFSLEEHEVAGLIGLNGAGKTTFLKVLSGLLPTFRSDSICFCGSPVDFRGEDFKLCRYTVFAETILFRILTSGNIWPMYAPPMPGCAGMCRSWYGASILRSIRMSCLRELSTGNRKKAFLITAFALRPRLLLLDEPVNGLDFQSTEYLVSADFGI